MTSPTMTETQWSNKERQLKASITKARNQVPAADTLAAKIEAKGNVKAAEEALRQHRLKKFDLVS